MKTKVEKTKINNKENNQSKFKLTKYLKKYWLAIVSYIFVYTLACVCTIFSTIFCAHGIEMITVGDYRQTMLYILYVLILVIVRRLTLFLTGVIYNKYSVLMMSDMNRDLSRQAFKLDSKTYSDHDTGTFVQRIVHDPTYIVETLANVTESLAEVVTASIMFVYISTLNIYVGIIMIVALVLSLVIEYYRIKIRRVNRHVTHRAHDDITSLTTEIVRSEKDIKSLGLEQQLDIVARQKYDNFRKVQYKKETTDVCFWNFRNILLEITGVALVLFCVWFMNANPGVLTLASFMIIYSNRDSTREVVWNLGNIANCFIDIKVSLERMNALFDEQEYKTEKFGNVTLENVVGKIEFKNVGYSYYEYEQTDIKEKLKQKKKGVFERKVISTNTVFDDLSFEIEPNHTVAFVGRSGSGKSTILNLMSKMNKVEKGEVLIDGVNINDLSKETLRNSISLVNQFPYIFDMTIKENLLLAKKDATDEEINQAIKDAYLEDFVGSLAKGIDTQVGESGIKLSGGQKQRLAIARAMLRKSPITIFDESTSSLDNFAQEEVKKSIDGMKGKSTIVIVAHRLTTIKDVDKIFFLEKGKIVDSGTFKELSKRNKDFQAMFYAENHE